MSFPPSFSSISTILNYFYFCFNFFFCYNLFLYLAKIKDSLILLLKKFRLIRATCLMFKFLIKINYDEGNVQKVESSAEILQKQKIYINFNVCTNMKKMSKKSCGIKGMPATRKSHFLRIFFIEVVNF